MRILITDDSMFMRTYLQNMLEPLGSCTLAADGRQGLDVFRQAMLNREPFDLVIMDIDMPEMTGLEAARKMRKLQELAEIPSAEAGKIIILSRYDDSERMMEAQFDSGADIYLTKPVEKCSLMEALRSLDLIAGDKSGDDDECEVF